MLKIGRKINEQKWLAVFVFSFVFVLGIVGIVSAFALPIDSHIYQYITTDGGKTYQLQYLPEYNIAANSTGCKANECYFGGECFGPGYNLYQKDNTKKNLQCLFGAWRNTCGNGAKDINAGEACDGAGNANYCVDTFGQGNWYKGKDVKLKCTSTCAWEKNCSATNKVCVVDSDCPTGETCIDPVITVATCGGYCGDSTVQAQFGEQCDKAATRDTIYSGGLGGLSKDNQYVCDDKCKSSGGFCGDGQVEADKGESCDWFNFNPPTPEASSSGNRYQCQKAYQKTSSTAGLCSGDQSIKCTRTGTAPNITDTCPTGKGYCDTASPCQAMGGFCGDHNLQTQFGEECDPNTVDLTKCTTSCKKTFCGDGIPQYLNGRGEKGGWRDSNNNYQYPTAASPGTGYEKCDDGANNGTYSKCAKDCSGVGLGGNCAIKACAKDLICSSNICKGALGGECRQDQDCLGGYFCDTSINQCKLYTSIFLNLHPIQSQVAAPSPFTSCPDAANGSHRILNNEGQCVVEQLPYNCPSLIITPNGDLLDQCTGLSWLKGDSFTGTNGLFNFGSYSCQDPYRLPTARELWSLVANWRTASPYTVQDKLKLGNNTSANNCPKGCHADGDVCKNGSSHVVSAEVNCNNSPETVYADSYLYWTSDQFDDNNGYAVNFGTGGIDTYGKNTLLRARCVRLPPHCGDFVVNGQEECDASAPANIGRGKLNGETCASLGFSGNKAGTAGLACDTACHFVKTNCANVESAPGKSCDQVCSAKGLLCKSIGVDSFAQDDNYYTTACGLAFPEKPCSQIMGDGGGAICAGKKADWTNCNCGGW